MARRGAWVMAGLLVALASCGDTPPPDQRGYSKAPLEKPGLFPTPEPRSEVSRFARPDRPVPERITLPDTGGATR